MKDKLRASVLMETIVASVLFLAFTAAFTGALTVSLPSSGKDPVTEAAISGVVGRTIDRLTRTPETGDFTETYHWGTLRGSVTPYDDSGKFLFVTMEIVPSSTPGRKMFYRIIDAEYEPGN